MKEKVKILVTDDHPMIRRGLVTVIDSVPYFEVIDEAENGEIALQKISTLRPDIIVLDIDMPVLDGIETAKIINETYPEVKIVFLSMHKDKQIINLLINLKMKGYVLKDSAVLEIVDCLMRVSNNETFISPSIEQILNDVRQAANLTNKISTLFLTLSTAELQVLGQISDLKTNREIAQKLFISIRTVENHRYKICQKLNLSGNHSLLRFALDNKMQILDRIKDK